MNLVPLLQRLGHIVATIISKTINLECHPQRDESTIATLTTKPVNTQFNVEAHTSYANNN